MLLLFTRFQNYNEQKIQAYMNEYDSQMEEKQSEKQEEEDNVEEA